MPEQDDDHDFGLLITVPYDYRQWCEICEEPYYFDSALGMLVPSCNCAAMMAKERPDAAEEPADALPIERSFEDDGLDTTPILKADL